MAERRTIVCDVCDLELERTDVTLVITVAVRRRRNGGIGAPRRLDLHRECLTGLRVAKIADDLKDDELALELPQAPPAPGPTVDGGTLPGADPLAPPAAADPPSTVPAMPATPAPAPAQ